MPDPNSLPIRWAQGEHVAIIGQTGSGKTYLETKLLPLRDHVVMLRTKADDNRFPGFHRIEHDRNLIDRRYTRFVLDPKYEQQGYQGALMLDRAWHEGGWTVAIDELYYASQELRLTPFVNRLLTQGRSKRITVVTGMQRPAWVSRFALSEVTHAFVFRLEGRDAKTIIGQSLSPRLWEAVEQLHGYDFAYYHRPSRTVAIGNARSLGRLITR